MDVVSARPTGRFAVAARWSYAMDAGQQVLNVGLGFVLAALLGPEAYGLVAMAMVMIAFMNLLQQQGMAAALVQRKLLSPDHCNAAFWMVAAVGIVVAVAGVLLAEPWATWNGLPQLASVTSVLSILIPIRALSSVQEALMRRQMRFKMLTIRSLIATGAGGLAGLVAAFSGWGVWSLVAQQIVLSLVALLLLWGASDWRPGLRFSRQSVKDLLGFSTGSFLSSLGVFVNNMADVVVVGHIFGPLIVGVYRFGARLVEVLEGLTSRPVRSLALPDLAPAQDDPPELASRLKRLMGLSAWTALPLFGVLAACAPHIPLVIGKDWEPAVMVAQFLCLVGAVRVLVLVDGPLMQAVGRPHLMAVLTWVLALVSVATFVASAYIMPAISNLEEAAAVALGRAIVYSTLLLMIHFQVVTRLSPLSAGDLVRAVFWPLLAGLAGTFGGLTVSRAVTGEVDVWLSLGLTCVGSVTFALATLACSPRARGDLTLMVTGRARRRGGVAR